MTLNDIDIFKQACLINGEWVTTSDSLEVDNPATGEVIATIPQLDADAVNQAVTAANDAFKLWRKKTPAERGELVRKWYELMVEHTDLPQRGLHPGFRQRG